MIINKHIKHAFIRRPYQFVNVLFYDERKIKEVTREDLNAAHIISVNALFLKNNILTRFVAATGLTEEDLLKRVEQKSITMKFNANSLLRCEHCGSTSINRKGFCRDCKMLATREER